MGLFSSILHKLGFGSEEEKVEVEGSSEVAQASTPVQDEGVVVEEVEEIQSVKEIPVVDVLKHLEELSAKKPGLNWKTSIVDLLKLLDIESSYSFRKELAKELNCPEDFMSDSAKMNVWLHKTVLKKIAQNGGNIPQDLLD